MYELPLALCLYVGSSKLAERLTAHWVSRYKWPQCDVNGRASPRTTRAMAGSAARAHAAWCT
jgi:hypothetical protein